MTRFFRPFTDNGVDGEYEWHDVSGLESGWVGDDGLTLDDWDDEPDYECPECHGTGGNPWNDGCTPCPECDGEGYLWWL